MAQSQDSLVIIITPRTARRYLRDIRDPQLQFKTRDGQTLKNLIELACYLKSCRDDAFKYHVSREHNHFSNWVEHAVLDKALAREMSLVVDRNPMRIIVTRRVNILVHHAVRRPEGREKAMMILEDAQLPEEHFTTNSGLTIRNLWEMREFIERSPVQEISYHHSPVRNDFAEWVAEVLLDFELAERMMQAQSREEMAAVVASRISELEAFRAHKPRRADLDAHISLVRGAPLTV